MHDEQRSKEGLIQELKALRQLNSELQASITQLKSEASASKIEAEKNAAVILSESEERLKALMDFNPSLVFLKDEEGRYVYLNKTYEQHFVGSEDWYGKNDYEFWPEESADLFRANDKEVLESGIVHQYLEDSTDLDGNRLCWLCYKFPFIDSKNRKYLGGIGIDATQRIIAEEALQESERRYAFHSTILESVRDPVWVSDSGLRIVYWNDAATATFGWTADEAMGRHTSELFKTLVPGSTRDDAVARLLQMGDYRDEAVCYCKDGSPILAEVSSRVVRGPNGEVVRLVNTARDITERKRMEEALRESMEREAYLLLLSDLIRPLDKPGDIQTVVVNLLADYLGTTQVSFNEWNNEANNAFICTQTVRGDMKALSKTQHLNWYPYTVSVLRSGEVFTLENAYTSPLLNSGERRQYKGQNVCSQIIAPIFLNNSLVASLSVRQSTPRDWTTAEIALVKETAERLRESLETANARLKLLENAEREAYLLKLSDALRPLYDTQAIQSTATQLLADHLGSSQSNYSEYGEEHLVITSECCNDSTIRIAGSYRLSDLPVTTNIMNSGQDLIIPDMAVFQEFSEKERAIYLGLNIHANLAVPLIKEGKLVATLSVRHSTPREWTQTEVELIHETAERTWASVERARAEDELKKTLEYLEEKVAERTKELSQERQRLFDVLETLPVNICLLASDFNILFTNRAFRETFGEPHDRTCYNYICDLDKCEGCGATRVFETGEPHHWYSSGPDGSIAEVYDFPFTDVDGTPLVLEMNMDITERIQAEEALRQSEERFHKAFHLSPIMMAILNMNDNRFIEVNKQYADTLEYSRAELIGHTPMELGIYVEKGHTLQRLIDLKDKNRIDLTQHLIRTKSGKMLTILGSIEVIKLNNMECRLLAFQDISLQKETEANIARLDRLNLIGEMAASIGHEIRNPMTAIRGFLQILNDKECYEEDRTFFELMIEELDRANDIISEFLGMAKDKRVELRPQYLDKIIKSLFPMIQADANYKEMDVHLALGNPPIPLLDANEIRQLILNISRNGLEAMSPGGILTIGTTFVRNEIVLFIKDQGSGLAPELIDKMGTPFVSTKEKGTGLGLAVCYSIAARHNARIDFETGQEGTTFYIRFPMPVEQLSLF